MGPEFLYVGLGTTDPVVTLARMKILVTGGAGYIGSVTAKALEDAGHVPVVLDSLLTGPRAFVRDRIFYEGDIGDRELVRRIVAEHPDLDATIHMAARIVVPESVAQPYEYYRDNVARSLELFDELVSLGKPRIVFSSSGSLYAFTDRFEVREGDPLAPTSPYARTKRMIEEVLVDLAVATDLRAILLRYFNPIGSDPDLESGIYAREPSHVLGQLMLAASGQQEAFTITGTEHPTRDGTGLRDYLHVWDLARAHVRAVEQFDRVLAEAGAPSVVLNLGRGDGVTVRELVEAFERVTGRTVPIREAPPRPGDAIGAYANVDRAHELLGWKTELSLDEAISSALAWDARRAEILGYP
jgi:UDP-glucose 4-epimerase